MPIYNVCIKKQLFYEEETAFQINADDEEKAKQKAIKIAKTRSSELNWNKTCLTKKPRPKVEGIVLADENNQIVDFEDETK